MTMSHENRSLLASVLAYDAGRDESEQEIASLRARICCLEEAIDQAVQVIEHGLGDTPINHALGILRAARIQTLQLRTTTDHERGHL